MITSNNTFTGVTTLQVQLCATSEEVQADVAD